ncbi:MAG: hypothetical protein DHS80DRAFT_32265 [Piptocephalis tieghemiana]|nr:MAG: hypothetical protein DHS80DRAFT_32265 [Piptocephalis tieghemiana]
MARKGSNNKAGSRQARLASANTTPQTEVSHAKAAQEAALGLGSTLSTKEQEEEEGAEESDKGEEVPVVDKESTEGSGEATGAKAGKLSKKERKRKEAEERKKKKEEEEKQESSLPEQAKTEKVDEKKVIDMASKAPEAPEEAPRALKPLEAPSMTKQEDEAVGEVTEDSSSKHHEVNTEAQAVSSYTIPVPFATTSISSPAPKRSRSEEEEEEEGEGEVTEEKEQDQETRNEDSGESSASKRARVEPQEKEEKGKKAEIKRGRSCIVITARSSELTLYDQVDVLLQILHKYHIAHANLVESFDLLMSLNLKKENEVLEHFHRILDRQTMEEQYLFAYTAATHYLNWITKHAKYCIKILDPDVDPSEFEDPEPKESLFKALRRFPPATIGLIDSHTSPDALTIKLPDSHTSPDALTIIEPFARGSKALQNKHFLQLREETRLEQYLTRLSKDSIPAMLVKMYGDKERLIPGIKKAHDYLTHFAAQLLPLAHPSRSSLAA